MFQKYEGCSHVLCAGGLEWERIDLLRCSGKLLPWNRVRSEDPVGLVVILVNSRGVG